MAKPPPSLGDSPEIAYKMISETYPLPEGGQKGLVSLFEKIIRGGGVQKILIQLGKPIQVYRNVQSTGESEEVPETLYEEDLYNAARNTEIVEFTCPDGIVPTEYLRRAFASLSRKRLKPKAFLLRLTGEMYSWLGADPAFTNDLFGVEVLMNKDIPDSVLLLVATTYDDPETVVFSLRLEMWQGKGKKK